MERVPDYLARAAALRDKAQATKDETLRASFLELAIAYEELAASIALERQKSD